MNTSLLIWVGPFLFLIVLSLGLGVQALMKGATSKTRLLNVLKMRIALSLALFGLLWVGYGWGWIMPHGL